MPLQLAEYLHHTHCPPWQVLRVIARRRVSSCPRSMESNHKQARSPTGSYSFGAASAQKPRIRAWVNPKATEVRGIFLLVRDIKNLVDSFAFCWRPSPVEARVPRSPICARFVILAIRRISDSLTSFHRRETFRVPVVPAIHSSN